MNTNVTLSAPANCAGDFLRVAASGRSGAKAWYSNFGALIDVTAPGGSITAPGGNLPVVPENGVLSTIDGDNYQFREGTSMATPHVAGVAALITEVAPDLTPAQVARIIKRTAKPLPGPCGGGCGDGLLDAHAAVKEALRPSGTGSLGSSS
jgi:serine protease